jgi:hypothetical protein
MINKEEFVQMLEECFREKIFHLEINTVIDAEDGKMIEISINNILGSNISSAYISVDRLKSFINSKKGIL